MQHVNTIILITIETKNVSNVFEQNFTKRYNISAFKAAILK